MRIFKYNIRPILSNLFSYNFRKRSHRKKLLKHYEGGTIIIQNSHFVTAGLFSADDFCCDEINNTTVSGRFRHGLAC